MTTTRIKHVILGLAFLGAASVATANLAPEAHAASSTPTIVAYNSLITTPAAETLVGAVPFLPPLYTYFYVGGDNFTPGGMVTITVTDSATGAVLDTVQEQSSVLAYAGGGVTFNPGHIGTGFTYAAPCSTTQVTIQAIV